MAATQSLGRSIYSTLIKRNSVFLGTVFFTAFAFEMAYDTATSAIWDQLNRGRQWKDIKHKYIEDE